ncbi:MAG: DUF2075 domain-containing protein [Acetatifactor sp.]|nr:DUF2075 domain-containing protein [Acetatifactor sp.]
MFTIKNVDFMAEDYGIDSYLRNWPMLYILEDGHKAYVGQTNSIVSRMTQHKNSKEKAIFKKAHFIYYDKSNQSSTFDYESRLISLMSIDNVFTLTNKNAGLVGLEYYDKASYDDDFRELWTLLRNQKLAKQTIDELEKSDLFKFSPYKSLTDEQRTIVSEIMDSLKKNLDRRFVVDGLPGTGKTILAVYLMKMLRETPEFSSLKIGLVEPPTSLRKSLKELFGQLNHLSAKDVYGPSDIADEKFDILLVDESHRLKQRKNLTSYVSYDNTCSKLDLPNTATQLDWILHQSRCAILFYDAHQIVFPAGLNVQDELQTSQFGCRMMAYYSLMNQMRCKSGNQYLIDLDKLLHCKLTHGINSSGYELYSVKDMESFLSLYKRREQDHGLTRLIAGYAWKWKSKGTDEDSGVMDFTIESHDFRWNSTTEKWVHSQCANKEVGCIHSVQGYDLNYGFVILGEDIKYDPIEKRIYADREAYFDKYGKNGASDEELTRYVINVYYVLLTRGVLGTYLYVCNKELREYLKQYIPELTASDID